jgi:phosphatidate cytidylyltransferase
MLMSRVISGVWLAALAAGVIVGDAYLVPWYPCLFVAAALFTGLGARELVAHWPAPGRPPEWLAVGGVVLVIAANWVTPAGGRLAGWAPVLFAVVAVGGGAFAREMLAYPAAGPAATARIANTVFAAVYLGVLPSFLLQVRWSAGADAGLALALAVFVPKAGDVGAYTAGRLFGRHKMTPALSPKKTWEGFAGGLAASVLIALLLASFFTAPHVIENTALFALGFGLTVGLAAVAGDLAESLLKRDAGLKDAGSSVPGFGGVLDVLDSVLFAAPVAYLWFSI